MTDSESDSEFDELVEEYTQFAEKAAEQEEKQQESAFTKVELFRMRGGQGKWPKKPKMSMDPSLILESRTRSKKVQK